MFLAVKWPKFRPESWDFGDPFGVPFLKGCHHAKFNADGCHCRRDICRRTNKQTNYKQNQMIHQKERILALRSSILRQASDRDTQLKTILARCYVVDCKYIVYSHCMPATLMYSTYKFAFVYDASWTDAKDDSTHACLSWLVYSTRTIRNFTSHCYSVERYSS